MVVLIIYMAEQKIPHRKPAKDCRFSELSVWVSGLDSNCRYGPCSREAVGVRRFGTMLGSDRHRKRRIFTKHRAIDRLSGQRYSRGQSKEAFKSPIRFNFFIRLEALINKTLWLA